MALSWQSILSSPSRRRQTILIICSAVIPFTFIVVWLLSGSQPPVLTPEGTGVPDGQQDSKSTADANTVKAATGNYIGKIDENHENVREFLNVPYGMSTAGKNRFMPPIPVPHSDMTFDATRYALACPQYVSAGPTVWSEQISWYRIPHGNKGEVADLTTEDCLSLAIWAPKNATLNSNLPVAMFWPGGGFQTNGILVPAHQAAPWVARTQSHIVVTINYRLSIMGFPSAAGTDQQNLGLLDQREALIWVRDNIHHFGGDPSRILVWGFSAGAQSVDFHNYAYWEDPIARAFFAQSGSCLAFGSGQSEDHSKFTYVAKNLGCDYPDDSAQELECMQSADYKDVVNFIGHHAGEPRLRFGPVTDGKIVFADYPERYGLGMVTKVPMIYSSCANDGSTLSRYDAEHPDHGPDQAAVNSVTKRIMCGATESSKLRHEHGLTTYRYQYAGNFPNQSPLPWMGAYHSSDLVMFFGTYDNGAGSSSTPLEVETSEKMQDVLLSFIRNAENGPATAGWIPFDPGAENGGTMLQFGANGRAVQNASAKDVEGVCSGQGTYDPFP